MRGRRTRHTADPFRPCKRDLPRAALELLKDGRAGAQARVRTDRRPAPRSTRALPRRRTGLAGSGSRVCRRRPRRCARPPSSVVDDRGALREIDDDRPLGRPLGRSDLLDPARVAVGAAGKPNAQPAPAVGCGRVRDDRQHGLLVGDRPASRDDDEPARAPPRCMSRRVTVEQRGDLLRLGHDRLNVGLRHGRRGARRIRGEQPQQPATRLNTLSPSSLSFGPAAWRCRVETVVEVALDVVAAGCFAPLRSLPAFCSSGSCVASGCLLRGCLLDSCRFRSHRLRAGGLGRGGLSRGRACCGRRRDRGRRGCGSGRRCRCRCRSGTDRAADRVVDQRDCACSRRLFAGHQRTVDGHARAEADRGVREDGASERRAGAERRGRPDFPEDVARLRRADQADVSGGRP